MGFDFEIESKVWALIRYIYNVFFSGSKLINFVDPYTFFYVKICIDKLPTRFDLTSNLYQGSCLIIWKKKTSEDYMKFFVRSYSCRCSIFKSIVKNNLIGTIVVLKNK